MNYFYFTISDDLPGSGKSVKSSGGNPTNKVWTRLDKPPEADIDAQNVAFGGANYTIKIAKYKDGAGFVSISSDDKLLPDGNYAYDSDKKTLQTLEEFFKSSPPVSEATETEINYFDSAKTQSDDFFTKVIDSIDIDTTLQRTSGSPFVINGAANLEIKRYIRLAKAGVKVDFGKPYPEQYNNVKDTPKLVLATRAKVITQDVLNGLIKIQDDGTSPKLRDLIAGGKSGFTEGTKEKILYDNLTGFLTVMGASESLESVKADPSKSGVKKEESVSTSFDENLAKKQIVAILNGLVEGIEKPGSFAEKLLIKASNFENGRKFNTEIRGLIKDITDGKEINPTNLADQITSGPDQAILAAIPRVVPSRLEGKINESGNKDARLLLKAGSENKLTGDSAKLYKNCVEFADYLGIKDQFESISAGSAVAQSQAGEGPSPGLPDVAPAVGGAVGSAPSPTLPGAPAGEGPPESIERAPADAVSLPPPPPAKPEDYVYFYYKLIRVDPDAPPPVLKVSFPNSKDVLEYTISQEQLGMRLSFVVDDQNRENFQKAVKDTDLTVSVTATPFTGGGPITLKAQIPFSRAIPSVPKMLTFSFADVKGKTVSQGIKTGRTGVAIDGVKEGTVTEVYYNGRGGIATTVTDATCSAKGRTYTFTFERGLMIPVKIPASLQESTQHNAVLKEAASTVPHWLFIKPKARGAGPAATSSGAAAPAGDGMASVNIAVRQIQIKTREEWIKVPNTGNPWDLDSFKFALMDGAPARPGAGKILSKKEAKRVDEAELARILFVNSDAWALTGIACFGDDPSVSGYDSSITTREIGRPVSMVSG